MSKVRRKKLALAQSMANTYHDACRAGQLAGDVDHLIYAMKNRYGMDATQLEAAKEALRAVCTMLHNESTRIRDELLGPSKAKTP